MHIALELTHISLKQWGVALVIGPTLNADIYNDKQAMTMEYDNGIL